MYLVRARQLGIQVRFTIATRLSLEADCAHTSDSMQPQRLGRGTSVYAWGRGTSSPMILCVEWLLVIDMSGQSSIIASA